MKVKFSLIPFIPVIIATTFLKLMSLYGLDGGGMFLGMNKIGITYAVIGLSLALFLICVLINIIDRKTAPVYPVKKNPISGVLSILAGISVAASAITTLLNTGNNSEYYLMTVVCAAFSVPAAFALMLMSKIHFTGKSTFSGVSMLFIFPALWGCSELVSEFLVATKTSISAGDMTALFCYIFITLYYFSHSMIVSRIKGRNPVKACFIYGLPAIALTFAYGLYVVLTATVEGTLSTQLLLGAEFLIFSLYALSFIVEMAFNSYTKDEIEIIDGMPDDNDTYESSYVKSESYDDLVFAEKRSDEAEDHNEKAYETLASDIDDYVIGFDENQVGREVVAKTETTSEAEQKEVQKEESTIEEPSVEEPQTTEQIKVEPIKEESVNAEPVKKDPVEVKTHSAEKKPQPKKELSDIDLLLQELDSKK